MLHVSVAEHLGIVLIVNATVFFFAQTSLECILSSSATLLSSIAIVLKRKQLLASMQAAQVTLLERKREIHEAERAGKTLCECDE